MRRSFLALACVALTVAAACGGGADDDGAPRPSGQLVAQVASYDLAVGENRLIVGLLTPENEFVSGGTATFRLTFLGDEGGEPVEAEASFLAIPGEEPGHEHPQAGSAADGRGVYAATVTLDRAGTWQVDVEAEVDGRRRTGTAAFQVLDENQVPAVGDRALRTENLTLDDADDAPPGAIDSRAEGGEEIPDPDLHDTTIRDALRAGHPIVAVFATPVYCVSQFCGPVTDMIEDLADEYGDRAEFIHVEIWRDFQGRVINKAAADWLLRNEDLQEPWVYFIDADGVIRGRWDNVATPGEIEPFLRDLPPLD